MRMTIIVNQKNLPKLTTIVIQKKYWSSNAINVCAVRENVKGNSLKSFGKPKFE